MTYMCSKLPGVTLSFTDTGLFIRTEATLVGHVLQLPLAYAKKLMSITNHQHMQLALKYYTLNFQVKPSLFCKYTGDCCGITYCIINHTNADVKLTINDVQGK